LRIAAKIDSVDQSYFDQRIRPLLDHPLVEFIGEIDDAQKNDIIGNARALLFPIDWPEPFGIVMIESFACGTPVIAYRCGSVPEVMEHAVTGFIVDDQEGAIAAARAVDRIDRRVCRRVFEERFTSTIMARNYVDLYRTLLQPEAVPMNPGAVYAAAGRRAAMRPPVRLPATSRPGRFNHEVADDATAPGIAATAVGLAPEQTGSISLPAGGAIPTQVGTGKQPVGRK